jgi:dinuclear metal center YbgI/SA1388 family protein
LESLSTIVDYVNRTLNVSQITDYCPNGLQVEGRQTVQRLITGVTASGRFLDQAIANGADAVLVHHGYFWRGESPVLTGMKLRRIRTLLENDVSLLAYHLPLDTHLTWGNNAQLAARLGIRVTGQYPVDGVEDLLWVGELATPHSAESWVAHVSTVLRRQALAVGGSGQEIKSVGWCSGGGQRFISQAADLGLDAYLSGEISEQTTHEAREREVLFVAAGHHATERYGVLSLGEHLEETFAIEHEFLDVDNPA